MLEGLRKASQGAVGKVIMTVLMGLLIVSFAVWGVGDMLRGFTSTTVAKVGSTTISAQEYSNQLQSELYRMQRRLRQPLTAAQARALGLDAEVLGRMIDEAALNERARAMGLAVSAETIAEELRNDPNLKGLNGQFDRARFEELLRNNGLSESGFFAEQRKVYLRQQIQYALADGLAAPKPLVQALLDVKDETREIAYYALTPAAAGDIAAPSDEALKKYFDARKAQWRAPEYRSFDALLVTPATLAKPDSVSDADAQAQYEKDKAAKYTIAEKRKLQQIVFPNEAEAAEAAAKIEAGASFEDVAKARKLGDADLNLGEVTKAGLFDPAVAEAGFATAAGAVSAPVKGRFGFVLVKVLSVTPGSVKPFEAVSQEIKKAIAASRAVDQVQSLHDRIEDARGGGKSLAEAAKSVGLEVTAFAGVDRDGKTAAGAAAGVFDSDLVLPAAFASDVGVDDEPIASKDGGNAWFSVTKIEPAHDRGLAEVKDKVAAAWRADETARRLADSASQAVKQLDSGGDIAELAKAAGAEVKTAKDVRRDGGGGLSPQVAGAAFGVGPQQAGSVATPDGRHVFKVTADAIPAPVPGDPQVAGLANNLKTEMGSSLVEQYVDALKRRIGVTIDRGVLKSAEGG